MEDPDLPSGTVTFFFSDIEGSTRLWESYPAAMKTALERHDRLIRQAIEDHCGQIIKTTGDGFHAAFDTAAEAAQAALAVQLAIEHDGWVELQPRQIRVRVGLHTGEAGARARDYFGTAVNRAARLMAIGHGGQILLSNTTAGLLRDQLPPGVSLLDLGEHRLKDLVRPEHVYQILHPDLPAEFPPLTSLDAFPNNLPIQLTSYVGREREMVEVKRLFAATRLLTLIGPGGIGKTRLALQVAADLLSTSSSGASALPDGVWLIELAPLALPAQVLEQIASLFDLQDTRGSSLEEMLVNHLRSKRLLLVLDNCEHLVEECARLAGLFLRTCPGLKLIASSREALGIAGETIFRVPSLSLPDAYSLNPADLMQYEAVQLFLERALAAQPHFLVTERNAPAVARICQRLDGIPLALELAAARIPVFTPEQIAARLDDRFRLLTGGSRTALPRQQTLRALIDWSYELLSPQEQALFRRLSVFTGGWTLEAAEAICSDEPAGISAPSPAAELAASADIFDLLSHLVNKSLVNVNDQEAEARYTFLETIRQYAGEQLLAEDRKSGTSTIPGLRDRHLAYFLRWVQGANRRFIALGTRGISQLDTENENIRSAVEWGLEYHPEEALNLIGDLFIYFNIRIQPLEGKRLVRDAIARVESLPPAGSEAESDRLRLLTKGYLALAQFYMTLGEINQAKPILLHALELAKMVNIPEQIGWAYGLYSITSFFLDEVEEARSAAIQLENIARPEGQEWALALSLGIQSWAERTLGHLERSESLVKEARSLLKAPDDPMTYNTLLILGLEARIRGDSTIARDYLERCLVYTRLIRSRPYEAMVRSELAHIDRQTGDLEKAADGYRATIRMWNDLGHRAAIAHQLECFAFIAAMEGRQETAATLLGAAEALREAAGSPMTAYEQPEYQQALSRLRKGIEEEDFASFWQRGRRLALDEAIALAVNHRS